VTSTTEIIALEGGWDWRVRRLNPFKQFGKEIRNGEKICKDQCPYDYSLNAYLNPSYAFLCLIDPENTAFIHLMLRS
jgi:hypothetical protein